MNNQSNNNKKKKSSVLQSLSWCDSSEPADIKATPKSHAE